MFKTVNPGQNFSELENGITSFWQEHDIFQKSLQLREGGERYIFYDGPPFITGTPHYGSLLPSIAKDVIPRYQTMNGKYVERIWGWDCHGLPIENKVEKELGINNRRDIEKFGIRKFIDSCYKYTRNTSAEWRWYIDKIGRWVDMDNSYKTMDQDYMESVIWVFKQMWDKKMIYEGVRTSLYCTRCGTPVSNFEIAMDNSYEDMEDPAVTIKFPITSEGKFKGISVLAWTTTPWTLPANKALVVDPEETYIIANVTRLREKIKRAWLVKEMPAGLAKQKSVQITQAYLPEYKDDSGREIKDARIRKSEGKFELTKKFFAGDKAETGQLIEETEAISKEKYEELIKTATSKVIKVRYYYPLENGLTAEIDVYQNNLKGLNVIEVEFPGIKAAKEFKEPAWFGKEVTDSKGIYPPHIAGLTIEEVNNLNDEYTQKEHNYDEYAVSEKVIVAKKRASETFKQMDYETESEFIGSELLGLSYTPPFNFVESGENDHKIYEFKSMVHMEEGTGIVHSAPGFGEIDTEMGEENKLTMSMDIINDEGKYIDKITTYAGQYIKQADNNIIADLRQNGTLFKSERIVHRYPYCWRCHTPLIHKAQDSWFVDIKSMKGDLLKNNDLINWVPAHLKYGRFKKGIEVAPDWGISRTRFWATPLPVWQLIEDGIVSERIVIGSRDELREKAVQPITKIVFIRHAKRDKSAPNGSLTDEGKAQALELVGLLAEEKFDALVSGETERTRQTLQPLAEKLGKQLETVPVLGSDEYRRQFDEISGWLCKQHNVTLPSQLPEDILQSAFKELIAKTRQEMEEFLEQNQGKYLACATHAERIALFRHIYEGRNLKEALAMDVAYAGRVTMYFHGKELLDLHRPKIDEITIKGERGELTRVSEVLDVWMDSASMPYASKHYPFENKQLFEENYPADFIVEYIAQTRAWFYVMHVVSTALLNRPSFKNVLTTGVIFGTDGRKMSKSYGNYPDPKLVLEKYGAEAMRLYLMGSRVMLGEDINIDEEGIKEQLKTFILPLWNSYSFFVTYANMHNWQPEAELLKNTQDKDNDNWDHIPFKTIKNKLDQWIVARTQLLIRNVRIRMDEYNIPAAVRELQPFIDDLSKWYIRRSRDRFTSGDIEALSTLYYVLTEFLKLIAPVTPFLSESMYQNMIKGLSESAPESVHLTDYPELDIKFLEHSELLLLQMEKVRQVVALGQALRAKNGIKVRQPLAELEVKAEIQPKRDSDFEQWMQELICDELNVKKVQQLPELIDKKGWARVADQTTGIEITLNLNISSELKREGIIRELGRLIQNYRKQSGLKLGELIKLHINTSDADVVTAISELETVLKTAVNASEVTISKTTGENWQQLNVNEAKVNILVEKL